MDGIERTEIEGKLRKYQLVPVASLPTIESGGRLSEVLYHCNLPVVEITFRTPWAADGIREIRRNFPGMLVLAGTVLTPAQAALAVDAGAVALVSPGFSHHLAEFCRDNDVVYYPGVCTPSEVQSALDFGLDQLKFFPAEMSGGTAMLSLFREIYPSVSFIPTGGINIDTITAYLNLDNVTCCGGTWLCPESLMAEANWKEIENRVTVALAHIAIS